MAPHSPSENAYRRRISACTRKLRKCGFTLTRVGSGWQLSKEGPGNYAFGATIKAAFKAYANWASLDCANPSFPDEYSYLVWYWEKQGLSKEDAQEFATWLS